MPLFDFGKQQSISNQLSEQITNTLTTNASTCNQSDISTQTIHFKDIQLQDCDADFTALQKFNGSTEHICNNVIKDKQTFNKDVNQKVKDILNVEKKGIDFTLLNATDQESITNTINEQIDTNVTDNIANCIQSSMKNQLEGFEGINIKCSRNPFTGIPNHINFNSGQDIAITSAVQSCQQNIDRLLENKMTAIQEKEASLSSSIKGIDPFEMFAIIMVAAIIIGGLFFLMVGYGIFKSNPIGMVKPGEGFGGTVPKIIFILLALIMIFAISFAESHYVDEKSATSNDDTVGSQHTLRVRVQLSGWSYIASLIMTIVMVILLGIVYSKNNKDMNKPLVGVIGVILIYIIACICYNIYALKDTLTGDDARDTNITVLNALNGSMIIGYLLIIILFSVVLYKLNHVKKEDDNQTQTMEGVHELITTAEADPRVMDKQLHQFGKIKKSRKIKSTN